MTTKEFNNKVTNGFLKYFYAKRQEQYKIYEEEISKQTKNKKVQKNKITKKMNSPIFPLLSEMIKKYENNTDYDKSKDKSFLKISDANTLNFEYSTVEQAFKNMKRGLGYPKIKNTKKDKFSFSIDRSSQWYKNHSINPKNCLLTLTKNLGSIKILDSKKIIPKSLKELIEYQQKENKLPLLIQKENQNREKTNDGSGIVINTITISRSKYSHYTIKKNIKKPIQVQKKGNKDEQELKHISIPIYKYYASISYWTSQTITKKRNKESPYEDTHIGIDIGLSYQLLFSSNNKLNYGITEDYPQKLEYLLVCIEYGLIYLNALYKETTEYYTKEIKRIDTFIGDKIHRLKSK